MFWLLWYYSLIHHYLAQQHPSRIHSYLYTASLLDTVVKIVSAPACIHYYTSIYVQYVNIALEHLSSKIYLHCTSSTTSTSGTRLQVVPAVSLLPAVPAIPAVPVVPALPAVSLVPAIPAVPLVPVVPVATILVVPVALAVPLVTAVPTLTLPVYIYNSNFIYVFCDFYTYFILMKLHGVHPDVSPALLWRFYDILECSRRY